MSLAMPAASPVVGFCDRVVNTNTGIVHQDIERAEGGDTSIQQVADLAGPGNIGL